MKRTSISDNQKKKVFERDNYTCQYCGRKGTDADLQLDHLEPFSRGGTNDEDNLITACGKCNIQKREKILNAFFAEKERETKAKRLWAWLSITVATLGIVVSIFAALLGDISTRKPNAIIEEIVNQKIAELQSRVMVQEQQTTKTIADLKAAMTKTDGVSQAVLGEAVKRLEKRMTVLEEGVSSNPEKALSIPLLRKDVTILERSVANDVSALRREVDRVYDQGKWFIGLMVTMLLTIIGLAVSTLVSTRKGS